MSSMRHPSIPHTLEVHHMALQPGSSPPVAPSDISCSTVNNTPSNMNMNTAPGSNLVNNNINNNHIIGEHAVADIHSVPSSPWMLGSTDNITNTYPSSLHMHSTYPPQTPPPTSMLSQSPSVPMSVLPQQLQQQQQQQQQRQYQYHTQSYHHSHSHQFQHPHQLQHQMQMQPPEIIHWNGRAQSLPHNLPPPSQMARPMSLGQQHQQQPHSHSHSHLSHSHHSSHHSSHHQQQQQQPPPPPPILQGGGGAAIGYSGEAAVTDTLNNNNNNTNNNNGNGSKHNLNDSSNLATNNLAMLSAALRSQKSLYQETIFHQPSQSVEAVLSAGCEVMGFDIAEVWLRTGPKTHQLTNSHLRPTALEDSLRKQLVDVYYGEKSSERTHRLSPALCKRAKEANDVVWVTAHTPHGAEALRCSISNVRTAVAVPVCHEASNTNLTIIFFSIRRIIMRTTAVEFLVHLSLGAAVASVNSLAEDGLLDRPAVAEQGMNISSPQGVVPGGGTTGDGRHSFSRSEHIGGEMMHHETVVSTMRHQRMEKVSITGARLDLQWRQLQNVEYLTDGGNSWIHTGVYNGKPVVVKTLKPECQDLAIAINEIENELAIHSRLNHPNIVSLIGAGTTSKGVRFVVLERLDGGTLTQMLGYDTRIRDRRRRFWRKKHLSYLDVLKCARCIADAMAHCHEHAIPGCMVLHRDLKPDNIGFTLDGTVKVLDFGLARIVENASVNSNEAYAMSGETGSLRYMAPEVADALPYNHKADVYSWGMILWELNAGKKPFDGLNREMFYERVVHGGERPPLNKKWPEELKKLMSDCWNADMEVRPTFSEIVTKIDSLLNNEKAGGTGTTVKKKVSNTVRRISGMIDRHSTWF